MSEGNIFILEAQTLLSLNCQLPIRSYFREGKETLNPIIKIVLTLTAHMCPVLMLSVYKFPV